MTIIWFNLWIAISGHIFLVDTFETLEECQEARAEMETEHPGNYKCQWVQLEQT